MKIEKIDEEDYKKIFVISDLHGSYDIFEKFLKEINIGKEDLIIILGDSCDRGYKSWNLYKKYVNMINEGYNLKHIRGNHEDMMIKAMKSSKNDYYLWLMNGGINTLESFYKNEIIKTKNYSRDDLDEWIHQKKLMDIGWFNEFIENMPHMIIGNNNIFVHAGFDGTKSEMDQDEDFLLWTRSSFWGNNKTGKAIYYGHTVNVDKKIKHNINNVYGMDTGVVLFDVLACREIKSGDEKYIY